MKIGISATGQTLDDDVDVRFGRCPYFLIVETDEKTIKNVSAIENTGARNSGGAGISAAQLVADHNVDAIITHNFGPRAYEVFSQLKIQIYRGSGKIGVAVNDLLEGKLPLMTEASGSHGKCL